MLKHDVQVALLFESTPQSDHMGHIYRAFHAQMESVEGIFHWMTVLWERGFTHDNPQGQHCYVHGIYS
jgi:hypothetical protein